MATIKFSGFTAGGTGDAGTTQLVGFKVGDATANYKYSIADLATMLSSSISNFYTADGTIGTTRKALITDTVQFRNAGDTSDIFTLNTDGTFALGLGATTTIASQVAIGAGADASGSFDIAIGFAADANGGGSVAIGRSTNTSANGIAIGFSNSAGDNGISMGQSSIATGSGVAIGAGTLAPTQSIGLGAYAKGTGANSITLNANGSEVNPSTANAFGVYMSSSTAADFEVVAGGESRLNSNFRVSGQAYTPPHVIVDDLTVDWNNSNIQTRTLASGANTFTPSNAKAGATYILKLTQPSSGTATVSWESSATVNWPGGTAPTLSGTGKIDIVTLICTTGGATGGTFYANATLDFS